MMWRRLYKTCTEHYRYDEPTEKEETTMLLRTADPFRDFDRLTGQLLGTTNRPAVMPMDAWREGDSFEIEFDLPGVSRESIDLDVERNVLTVRAERVGRNGDWEMLASERPTGHFSRQLVLGDNLDLERINATYEDGVLRLEVPVAERAKPRKISVSSGSATAAEGAAQPGAISA
jgi:HSP20 family protein